MEGMLILALTALTSVAAYFFGVSRLRLRRERFGAAVGRMLDAVGTILIFLAVNLAVAVGIAVTARSVGGAFVSAYLTSDASVVGLSVFQGLVFHWWRELSGGLAES